MNKRKICVVTTSRADYGLLYWLMKEIQDDSDLKLQIIAAGMHLEPKFGLTYKIIEKNGLRINAKVNMSMTDDTEIGVAKSIGIGCEIFANAFSKLKPDIIVLLGDRFELISAAISALIAKIPIAHIHGGETSQGAIDEAIRHSITKMSAIHFACTEVYKKRIIQLGENPRFVFNYGAPGLDNIKKLKLLCKNDLQKELDFEFNGEIAIITYHPVTLEKDDSRNQIVIILNVLKSFEFKAIFTMANADIGGSKINEEIQKFCKKNPKKYKFFSNLGQVNYLSCLKNFDLMIGNSSSGIVESISFKIPVVNIGDRQKGRIKAENVIDVKCSKTEIKKAIQLALSKYFKDKIKNINNPYDKYNDGKVSYRIKEKLKRIRINENLIKKKFYDISFEYPLK
jgi:UDP-N-acetylglucosamine 2-epimerase (non-hydrolysing)/GDP/UDP-N,N'-diacetylbacillosamine 2-epimerase (hydrolysing)